MDGIIKIKSFDFNNISLDKKSCENWLIYEISYKTLIGAKPLCIMFHEFDGFIKDYNGTKYFALFGPEKNMMPFSIRLDIL